jgi:Flp pilus assembly protein TadD
MIKGMGYIIQHFLKLLIVAGWLCTVAPAIAAEDHIAKGYELLDAGRPADAVLEFKKALDAAPNDIHAHEGLAWAYNKLGDNVLAGWHADRRLELAPTDHAWRRQRAMLLFQEHARRYEALTEARDLVKDRPRDVEANLLLGLLSAWVGSYADARHALEFVLTVTPDNVNALRTLGRIESSEYNYEKAYRLLQRASMLQPHDIELRDELAKAEAIALQFRAARHEPTMLLTIAIIGFSIIIGQASLNLTTSTYSMVFALMCLSTGAAFLWRYFIPI